MDSDNPGYNSSHEISGTPVPKSPTPIRRKRSHAGELPAGRRLPSTKKMKYDKEVTFRILLPNQSSLKFAADAARIHSVAALLDLVKRNASDPQLESTSSTSRPVEWGSNLKLETNLSTELNDLTLIQMMTEAKKGSTITLLANDGHSSSYFDPDMWDVTPKPEMLGQLPQGYTLETALADHVDNALQAVWHNVEGSNRLVSVNLSRDQITIFDNGQGMDASSKNCIKTWGTVGGSTHRQAHRKGLGGKPPFLNPYLGKYGAGGVSAALHLGGCVTLWSKTRESNNVASLVLDTEELEQRNREDPQQGDWKVGGSFRQMTDEEHKMSPQGSFTRVEITKLRSQYCIAENEQHYWKVANVRQFLKEIYFPYIQSEDAASHETLFPVKFEVNGKDLVDVEECETAISNLHTCNGKPFLFDIHLTRTADGRERTAMKEESIIEGANARICCQYYPNLKGKEALEAVVEQLNRLQPSRSMTFENMNRVIIRWLGRLLPEVKWPVFPFMLPPKKVQKSVQVWARRVRAFVDTDAGFHPVQSKTQLETDQPFVVALKHIGSDNFDRSSASGVRVSIKRNGAEIKPSKLAELYLQWLEEMHKHYDEEFTFPFCEKAMFIFRTGSHGNCLKDLGVGNATGIVVHTHMKDSQHDWEINDSNPIFFKLPKGPAGLKADKYVTLEYFYHDANEVEGFQVNFLCRSIEVDASEGCKITLKDGNYLFELNHSEWFAATLLNTAERLDAGGWKKKVEEIFNKSPGSIEVLDEEETGKFQLCGAFPENMSSFEAGYSLPKDFLVVVRPRKGSGATKQGRVVPEPMGIKLEVKHCCCTSVEFCLKRKASVCSEGTAIPHTNADHARVVCSLRVKSTTKNGVKGLYTFSTESSEVNRLVKEGIYTFHFELDSEKYKDVVPAVYLIEIVPSTITARWTFCNHLDQETVDDGKTLVIRINEPVKEDLFLQKYDQYGNSQTFEAPMELEISVVTLQGESLEMHNTVQSSIAAGTEDRHRLVVKDILFASGSLKELGPSTHDALLRVRIAEEQHADIKCKVSPGALADVEVISSEPPILMELMHFEEDLLPGEVIRKLTIQGLDGSRNKIEKGQKFRVTLEGVEFQDDGGNDRMVDENGTLQLGGLLKVTHHYNSTGSITFQSGNGSIICTIKFRTVQRRLIADQVPTQACVGRQLQGVTIKMVDELGNVDTSVSAIHQSITVDWQPGVTYRLSNGECILPSIQIPDKLGSWKGNVSFSADPSLCVTLMVELKMGTATSLGPATEGNKILTAECGVPFLLPFRIYDENHMPALLSDLLKNNIKCEAKATGNDNDTVLRSIEGDCKDVKMSIVDRVPVYEAHIVVSGSVGMYMMTVSDKSLTLDGKAEVLCKVQHGGIAQLLLARSDGTIFQEYEETDAGSCPIVDVKRRSENPELTVTILDSHGNVCTSCEGTTLRVRVLDCPLWKEPVIEINRGIGRFKFSSLEVPVGNYQVLIELDRSSEELYSLEEIRPVQVRCSLRVDHGNYPSSLRLVNSDIVTIIINEEDIQYVPPMSVFIDSADGMRLRSCPTVQVKVCGDCFLASGPKEYLGVLEESCGDKKTDSRNPDGPELSSNSTRYKFSQVCVPSVASMYRMEFTVLDGDVPSQSRHLVVKHGPPKEILITMQSGEINALQVNIVDCHGNPCESISGLQLQLELTLTRAFTAAGGQNPCAVLSKCTAMVENGSGEFGVFELTQGMPGFYSLKIFPVHSEGETNRGSLTIAEAQVFIIKGDINQSLLRPCNQNGDRKVMDDYGSQVVKCRKEIHLKQAQLQAFVTKKKALEVDWVFREHERNALMGLQQKFNDAEILQAQMRQPLRSYQSIVNDMRSWAARNNNTAALAFWEAISEGRTFSRQLGDFLGLVVMLAQVEDNHLNRMLAEFLGPSSLLLIIVRSQSGVNALETYDAHGELDENSGLLAFARSRGYNMSGRYDTLALSDIKSFRPARGPAVNVQHGQGILNIDPPLLPSGRVPGGFLGYAVNLLYFRPADLQTKVYDNRTNMIFAKGNINTYFGGAISLDGGIIRSNYRQQLGRPRSNVPISFGLVPYEERRNVESLMPPACHSFQRQRESSAIENNITRVRNDLTSLKPHIEETTLQLKKLKTNLVNYEKQHQDENERTKELESQFVQVQRELSNALAPNKGDLTTKDRPSGQDDDKMRAFLRSRSI